MAKKFEMLKVKSSNIAAIGFHDGNLRVEFKSGATHDYLDVPEKTYREMRDAKSIGKFFYAHVLSGFKSNRVEEQKS